MKCFHIVCGSISISNRMNCNFVKLFDFKFQKKLHRIALKKLYFSHSAVSLENKCGSKGPPWRIMFFGNDDFSVTSLRMLSSKLYVIISFLNYL